MAIFTRSRVIDKVLAAFVSRSGVRVLICAQTDRRHCWIADPRRPRQLVTGLETLAITTAETDA